MAGGRFEGLSRRVLTAVVLAVVSFSLTWWGVRPFFAEVLLLALVGSSEFYDMAERTGHRPARRTGTFGTLLLLVGSLHLNELALTRLVLLVVLACMVVFVMRRRPTTMLDAGLTVLGILYIGWLFSYLMLLRRLEHGAAWITLLVCAVAGADIGAYFAGKFFGRHKLFPLVSPKKTVEGLIGGIVFAVGVVWFWGPRLGIPGLDCLVLGALAAVVGLLGDLWESAMKRDVGVKDSGDFISGHGGVLDRFDSLAFTAPIFYFYAASFG